MTLYPLDVMDGQCLSDQIPLESYLRAAHTTSTSTERGRELSSVTRTVADICVSLLFRDAQ
jgi:hypothetical protein